MLVQRTGRFRHIVFADAVNGSARAVNFAVLAPDLPDPRSALSDDEGSFIGWLLKRVGIDARNYREETLSRRLPACLRTLRVSGVGPARALLQRDPRLVPAAVGAILIGVSGFFRDAGVFAHLESTVLPDLLASRRGAGLRIWSAGCSDGAELYSIAIMLDELSALVGSTLLGTDCRADAVRCAALGSYDAQQVQSLSPQRLGAYFRFVPHRARWTVVPHLRGRVHWRTADLLEIDEPGPWDLILCRNVAMYMKPAASARLWERLESQLAPGGVLVLGKAERPAGASMLKAFGPCVYHRSA